MAGYLMRCDEATPYSPAKRSVPAGDARSDNAGTAMSFRSIPFASMQRHTAAAIRYGWSLDSLLTRSMIDLRHGDHRDAILPAQSILLCMNTVLAAEDATLGMVRGGLPASYPAIGATLALGCKNLEAGIRALARLYASASTGVRIQLRTEHEDAVLSVWVDPIVELDAAYSEEAFLLWTFMQCLHFLGRDFPIFEVSLREPNHFTLGRQHWGIRAPVRLDTATSFRFPKMLLAEPPTSRAGDNVMWECTRRWLEYVDGGPLVSAPDGYVKDSGFVHFADMVRESGRSSNTLRRYFRESQGSFRDARKRALVSAATSRLCTTDDDVESIALELGYSDARSFRRFLKIATGLTPRELRGQDVLQNSNDQLRVIRQIKSVCEQMVV